MLALQYLGLEPNTTKREDYKAAEDLLLKVRPYNSLLRFLRVPEWTGEPGDLHRDVLVQRLCAVQSARRGPWASMVNLAFTVPKEGTDQNFTSLLIPEGAPHPKAAYEFINFILRPDVIAEITNEILFGNDNIASRPLIKPYILTTRRCIRRPKSRRGCTEPPKAKRRPPERIRTRTWTRVKPPNDEQNRPKSRIRLRRGELYTGWRTAPARTTRCWTDAEREYVQSLPERLLAALAEIGSSLQGYPVSRLGHSLQTATRALKDGADDEYSSSPRSFMT